jgi:hypothetical protein
MDINFSAVVVTQDRIPRSGVFKLYFSVALRVQEFAKRGNILLLNGDVYQIEFNESCISSLLICIKRLAATIGLPERLIRNSPVFSQAL